MSSKQADIEAMLAAEDLEHQQLRILLLIAMVADTPGTGRKLDGLTKLAKLDFIARYPELETQIAAFLPNDVPPTSSTQPPPPTSAPMIRYRYGPWDDRYYLVIGGLVGRGLIRYTRGRQGSVALMLTPQGRDMVQILESDDLWLPVASRYRDVAAAYGLNNGNQLKSAIYRALPELQEMPLRTELR